jgi:Flp pilus assembly protein TadB
VTAIASLAGLLVVGGLWLAASSWRQVPVGQRRLRRRSSSGEAQRRLVLGLAGALVTLVVTRWPVAAAAAGVAAWAVAGSGGRKVRRALDKRTEAIALWAEMLRDAIGTARGVEGVLVATASTAPLPIRPEVQRMARRLQHESLDTVLDDLADDLDHPIGDLVVTALRLTSTAGGRQVRDVLAGLAAAAYAEAESRRRVEVARERPRSAMRYTAMIIGGFVTLLVVFSRKYLDPYDSALGQVVLVFVGFYWAAGFWWMHRMGRVTPVERFLAPAHVADEAEVPA